ncbi:hypothetical protein BCR41DRAFT_367847 [Lobosporangium transversale]|uniref:Uncharacterized protein n=1 Tax=Lobosporangium transversale TaxID=64571 RepID=A0A1Y2GYZ9_9FUNG|nr:hypothetical protein BCR41DRAFT_367847 [Lobosporangium transversale]ORZ27530.1 hypothetical protein BCR41DRAFT_367847 [Lobosporangium transversale]|eukprot:XP_021885257.1 hypothetical protein BCR41DRAFT_367847 [Lobosporangium transversale]
MIAELLLEASEKDAKISLLEAKEKDNKMTNLVEAKEKDDRIINLLMEASEKDAKINLLEAKVKDSKMINEKIANLQLELKEKDDEIINMLLKSKEKDGEMLKIQDEMLKLRLEARKKGGEMETKKKDDEMQAQALNNLTMHQKHAHSILTQDFELHECPFPRLFIILPLNCTKWDPVKLLGNKFRVHFLCECGDYTAMANKPNPGQIHIARHDGYEVRDCTGFFRKYGKYMLILLHWLKLGMALPDSLAPDPSLIDAGIDYSIDYLQALSKKYPALNKISTINDFEGLKKTELRQLGTSFRITDGNKDLGNLYRVTTETGYVKWVCHNHYRSMYKEKRQKAFEDVVKMNNAKYDSHLGKLVIKLGSKARAEEFFNVLTNAGRVYELDITFDWDWAESDLEAFENILKVSYKTPHFTTQKTATSSTTS